MLVVLLGLTWVFGFMYVNEDSLAFAYIFTILNSLQGLFIFIFHCFMDRKVGRFCYLNDSKFLYGLIWANSVDPGSTVLLNSIDPDQTPKGAV